ncbi:MAG: uroporphyrinogen decarboxylase family protein [candidate division NC10 bacterium]|nr:uroporphyrinogen decarboxylase family protein [candidate division NC10 bacterium]
MNSRERLMTALRREEPDRVPWYELAVDRALAQKLMGWKQVPAPAIAAAVTNPYTLEESKAIAARLGLDGLSYILRAPTYARMGEGIEGRGFPSEGLIKTEADLEKVQLPDPHRDELYADAEEFVRNKGDYAAAFVTRIGMFQVILGLGFEGFSLALYDNRSLVETLLDLYFDWMVVVAERMCQIGFDLFVTTDDFAFKTGMLFSPQIFQELMVPRYRKVLKKVTIPWVLHSDGKITEVVETLIELGVAGIHPNEKGAMDIRAMKRDYGKRVCLLGNVDLNLLGMGTPEEVDREVYELIRDVGPGGGYILTSGNSLASYLKPQCVLAMAQAVKKYGKYPIQSS